MTSERNNTGEHDEALSRVYRELSAETTPAALDDRVLREARAAARSGYTAPKRWMRPLAWAATVTLTISILVHMAELPAPDDTLPPAMVEQEPPAETLAAPGAPEAELRRDLTESTDNLERSLAIEAAPAPAAPGAPAERRERALQAEAARDADAAEANATLEEAARAMPEADMLRRASDLARQQDAGSEAAPAATSFAFSALEGTQVESHCDETARASAATWYECVVTLREAGLAEAADKELAELARAFPDFEIP